MTDTADLNDCHVASKERGWVQPAQRTARYSYRKVMAHVTNPDHLCGSVRVEENRRALQLGVRSRRIRRAVTRAAR
jgi:molybdenum-dependent DNA-binding transcriptional regulator ModE